MVTNLRGFADTSTCFRQGRVLLRAGARFLNELFAEFEGFPHGEYDDQVDTVTLPITAPSRR